MPERLGEGGSPRELATPSRVFALLSRLVSLLREIESRLEPGGSGPAVGGL
jgi:hypothetical protein